MFVIDISSKYDWVVPLKDKMSITITNAFQKILNESGHKKKQNWVDKVVNFETRSMKSWLKDNNIEKGKLSVAERFIRTLKNKIYKYMIVISKDLY